MTISFFYFQLIIYFSSYYQRPQSVTKSFGIGGEEDAGDKTLEEVLYGDDVSESSFPEQWGQLEEIINWEETARKAQKQVLVDLGLE